MGSVSLLLQARLLCPICVNNVDNDNYKLALVTKGPCIVKRDWGTFGRAFR